MGKGSTEESPMRATDRLLRDQARALERIAQYLGEQEVRRILATIGEPLRLEHAGRKVYSQGDEDGILGEILRRIGADQRSGVVIEFGVEDGLQSNTHWLLRQGYSVIWLECDEQYVKRIRSLFGEYLAKGLLTLAHEMVTRDTVDLRLATLANDRPVCVLSIDVDGNDYWLWQRVERIRPAVVVIEYNATYPPPVSVVQEYNAVGAVKAKDDSWGATLSALDRLAQGKGYRLVACGITGVNAFFVREDLMTQERFPYPRTPEALYHPFRRKLINDAFAPGFRPSVGRYVEV